MRTHNANREVTKYLSGSFAGFLSGNIYFIPNRLFMPKELHHTACEGRNLQYVGAQLDSLSGGSISFDKKSAILSTFGEFIERYSASFQSEHSHKLHRGISYRELEKTENVVDVKYLRHYQETQFGQANFPFARLEPDDPIDWVKGHCLLHNESFYYPAELVFLPYKLSGSKHYWAQTSTGLSAHITADLAMAGGYLECEERNAFSQWWYRQDKIDFIKYDAQTVLSECPSEQIRILFANDRVKLDVYDLGEFSNVETVVCFLQFEYKNHPYISIGCSSRFSKEEAITKACLEAYQGIDFAILLCNKEGWIDDAKDDFSKLDEFDKHFAYYNKFLDIRQHVPIYLDLLHNSSGYRNRLVHFPGKVSHFDRAEIQQKATNINYLLTFDVATSDARHCGYHVYRVVVPGFHLLTGNYNTPFLGFFEENEELFTHFPHPFP
ncbi:YcaO-like family protein [Sphingobacterium bambusae]|nr:YcaO-like family protein [Sphingobacterium bambusae]WPL51004.1 YcaO-like family protein [Sphingobacterium bambusae]